MTNISFQIYFKIIVEVQGTIPRVLRTEKVEETTSKYIIKEVRKSNRELKLS